MSQEVCGTEIAKGAKRTKSTEPPENGNLAYAWQPGHTVAKKRSNGYIVLAVKFLNGSRHAQLRVMSYAREWHLQSHARILFKEAGKKGKSDIRVVFDSVFNKSYIGNTARRISQKSPTLHLSTTPEDLGPIAIHEFGHVLGLVHADGLTVPWDWKLTDHECAVALRFYP